MKSTGIVRNVDFLGRVVIPVELRKTMELDINDPIEFFTDGDSIIIHAANSLEDKKTKLILKINLSVNRVLMS